MTMFLLIYHLLLGLILICASPVLLFRILTQKHYREGFWERLGFYSKALKKRKGSPPTIWIHGASVGEHQTILPFLDDLKLHFPEYRLFFSATTMTGVELLRSKKLEAIYFPLDFYWIAAKALKLIKPEMIFVLETELWPSFTTAAVKKKIPLVLVNGRISDFSLKKYLIVKLWVQKILNCFSLVCVQSKEDRNRFLKLKLLPEKLRITGNLKFDAASVRFPSKEEIEKLKKEFSYENSDQILVAGSTHRGEEKAIAEIFLELRKRFHNLRLILAPRHLTRVSEIEKELTKLGLTYELRTTLKRGKKHPPVIILNTLGELFKIYALANVVFMGRSLYGEGGQNPLEPAVLAKPVLFGPHMENFRQAASALIQAEGAFYIQSPAQLEEKLQELLFHPDQAKLMGKNAESIFAYHCGAADRTWKEIKKGIEWSRPAD